MLSRLWVWRCRLGPGLALALAPALGSGSGAGVRVSVCDRQYACLPCCRSSAPRRQAREAKKRVVVVRSAVVGDGESRRGTKQLLQLCSPWWPLSA